MDWIEAVGFCGTGLTLASWAMGSALHLRVVGLASSVAFLAYGLLTQSWPVVATELMLMPLNGWRLWQLLRRRRAVGEDAEGLDWLLPFARRERVAAGGAVLVVGAEARGLTLLLSGAVTGPAGPCRAGALLGDARPFERAREGRTLRALTEVEVARVDLAALEALALELPALSRRLLHLALDLARAEAAPAPLHAVAEAPRMAA
jgi:hypothetical protein